MDLTYTCANVSAISFPIAMIFSSFYNNRFWAAYVPQICVAGL